MMSYPRALVWAIGVASLGPLVSGCGGVDASREEPVTPGVYVVSAEEGAPLKRLAAFDAAEEPYGEVWLDLDQVAAIEAYFSPGDGVRELHANLGNERWTLAVNAARPDKFDQLDFSAEFKRAWRSEGVLQLSFEVSGRTHAITLRALPELLRPAEGGAITFSVSQEVTKAVPGSNGYLKLKLGDITDGEASVELATAEGSRLLESAPMTTNERRTFTFGDEHYTLALLNMVTLPIGQDWADFEIRCVSQPSAASRSELTEAERIEALLDRLANSDATFVREGIDYNGAEAAAHLRSKVAAVRDQVGTLEEFIEKVGSRSSTTGNPYYVKTSDGTTIEAGTWLRQLAGALEPHDVDDE